MSLILAPTRSIVRPKPLVGTQIDRGHPLARGLVGCWLMNEGAGNLVANAAGPLYKGTFYSSTALWVPTVRGVASSHDGYTSKRRIKLGNFTDGWNEITVAIACAASTTGNPGKPITKGRNADCGRTTWEFARNAAGMWTFSVPAGDTQYGATKSSHQETVWRQVVGTYNGAQVQIYIDGQAGTPENRTGPLDDDPLYPVYIAAINGDSGGNGDSSFFSGDIAWAMIWSRALSPSEIQSLYADPYQMFRRGNPVVLGASSANNYSFTINDGMGIGDDMGGAAAMLRGLSEAMGLGDDVSRAAAIQRAMSEAMGLTDTAARVATVLRALADSVGLTDETIEGAARQLVETINDAVGLTDAQSRLSVLVRAVADSLGMADAATTLAVLLRTISDAQGMTDGQTLARMIAVADDLGVSDEMGRIVAYLRGQSDSVGLSDTMTRLHAAVRQIADTEGLTDSYSTAWTVLRTIADTLGLTDAMIQEGTGALVRVINDVLGMVDAKTKLHAALRVLASTINTADSVSRLFAVSRVISDAEGITDGAYLGKVFTFAETIGISDEVTRLVAFLRTQDDTVGVLEAILKVSNVIRSLDDAIEMTDAEQHSLSGLVQAALAFLFLKKGR